ncbi:hypothetical protein MKW94_005666 [Papaver nudicaule]|uniref:Uncharacterized protein n=1 Tax=Papaver nudicaule TaxID=74823 RepID=A0AA41SAT7_PAPNU|nr:hypothetical protein [Papaver nudicaule]
MVTSGGTGTSAGSIYWYIGPKSIWQPIILSQMIIPLKEAYDKEPSAKNCLSTDAVSREFGVDRKGNVRGMGAGVSKTLYHTTAFMKARQINSRGHDQISSSSYQQEIGTLAPAPSSFRLCFLRNFRRKAVACAYVDRAKAPNDDDYDCMINEIMDSNAMLCDRDGVLGDVSKGAMIKWPKSFVTVVGEPMI